MEALYIIPILILLVAIHELGHFLSARLVGIRVLEFGIGLPPRIAGYTWRGVLYSLNTLPVGGFVRVLGEDGMSEAPDSLPAQSRPRRALFMVAGSLMNLLLGFVLITVLVGLRGETTPHLYVTGLVADSPAALAGWQVGDQLLSAAGEPLTRVDELGAIASRQVGQPLPVTLRRGDQTLQTALVSGGASNLGQQGSGVELTSSPASSIRIYSVAPGAVAEQAGLRPGDTLVRAGDRTIADQESLELVVVAHQGAIMPLTVQRAGTLVDLQLPIPPATAPNTLPYLGFTFAPKVSTHPLTWWKALPRGADKTVETMCLTVTAMAGVFNGQVTISNISGPIGMGQLTSEVLNANAEPAWATLTMLTALLSLNLALLNLIPLPTLDGGRLFFVLIEYLRGERVAPEREALIHKAGFVVLLGLMVLVAFHDVDHIVSGARFLR